MYMYIPSIRPSIHAHTVHTYYTTYVCMSRSSPPWTSCTHASAHAVAARENPDRLHRGRRWANCKCKGGMAWHASTTAS